MKRFNESKPVANENVGPGSYNYLPIIPNEGHKYSMSFSNNNLHVSPNDFVPGPKYLVNNTTFKKPLFVK